MREAYPGYVPLGVFNVRENVRNAMGQPGQEFESMKTALQYISARLELPIKRFIEQSDLLQEQIRSKTDDIEQLFLSQSAALKHPQGLG